MALALSLALSLACQTSLATYMERSPLALATSLARDRDMTRDWEGRELVLATTREELALEGQGREDTPNEVGPISKVCTKHRVCSRLMYLRTADDMMLKKAIQLHMLTSNQFSESFIHPELKSIN